VIRFLCCRDPSCHELPQKWKLPQKRKLPQSGAFSSGFLAAGFSLQVSRCSVPLTRARDSNPDVILQSTPPARWTTRSAKAVGLESNQQQPAKRQQELCQQHNGFSISCDFNYKVARRSPAHIFGRVGVSRQTDQLCLPIPTALELEWPAFCSALSATYNPLGESTKAAA
jgi:hypothetical protein